MSNLPSEYLSKQHYIVALEKLKGRDLVGVTGDILTTGVAGAAGVAASGTIASIAGASTLLGSSTLGSVLGGVFVTTTPVGWVVGCAVAASAAGYGISKLVRSGQKQDGVREDLRANIIRKVESHNSVASHTSSDELIQKIQYALENNYIDQRKSNMLLSQVISGNMSKEIAYKRINDIINPSR